MASIASAALILGVDSANFEAGLDKAGKKQDQFFDDTKALYAKQQTQLKPPVLPPTPSIVDMDPTGFLGKLGPAYFGTQILKDVKNIFNEISEAVDNLAQRMQAAKPIALAFGLTFNEAFRLEYALGDKALAMITKFELYLQKAALGAADARGHFANLGLSWKDLMNLRPDQAFYAYAAAIMKIGNASDRLTMLGAVFGSKGGRAAEAAQEIAQLQERLGRFDKIAIPLNPSDEAAIKTYINSVKELELRYKNLMQELGGLTAEMKTFWNYGKATFYELITLAIQHGRIIAKLTGQQAQTTLDFFTLPFTKKRFTPTLLQPFFYWLFPTKQPSKEAEADAKVVEQAKDRLGHWRELIQEIVEKQREIKVEIALATPEFNTDAAGFIRPLTEAQKEVERMKAKFDLKKPLPGEEMGTAIKEALGNLGPFAEALGEAFGAPDMMGALKAAQDMFGNIQTAADKARAATLAQLEALKRLAETKRLTDKAFQLKMDFDPRNTLFKEMNDLDYQLNHGMITLQEYSIGVKKAGDALLKAFDISPEMRSAKTMFEGSREATEAIIRHQMPQRIDPADIIAAALKEAAEKQQKQIEIGQIMATALQAIRDKMIEVQVF
jgi:hypothetical protein